MKRSFKACVLALGVVALAGSAYAGGTIADLLQPFNANHAANASSTEASSALNAAQANATGYAITQADVERELKAALVNAFSPQGTLSVRMVSNWQPLRLPGINSQADYKLTVDQLPSAGLQSRLRLSFSIHAEGQRLSTQQVVVRCSLQQTVWGAARSVNAGSPLVPADAKALNINVLAQRGNLVPAETNLSAYAAKTSLKAGELLEWRALEPRELVKKGTPVQVVAKQGLMQITLRGKALQGGALGELVRVRNPDSKEELKAEVVGENTVQILI